MRSDLIADWPSEHEYDTDVSGKEKNKKAYLDSKILASNTVLGPFSIRLIELIYVYYQSLVNPALQHAGRQAHPYSMYSISRSLSLNRPQCHESSSPIEASRWNRHERLQRKAPNHMQNEEKKNNAR